ncbi:hypothetical protein TNCV_5052081 [Trichonephila clavipes]|nr:hypothetical protein TNCV_5052081 [Trichonephila clavipes]
MSCVQKIAKIAYFAVNSRSQPMFFSEICHTEDKIEQKVCSLRLNRINIEKEGQEAKECLGIQAMKMKLSFHINSKASVSTTVCISIPKFDRGRGGARSVLAVFMENTAKGFFQLETRDSRIKQLYFRSQFSLWSEN